MPRRVSAGVCLFTGLITTALLAASHEEAIAQEPHAPVRTITDSTFEWPTFGELLRVLLLRDYNTRVVVIGTTLLGIAAGVIGTFAYLRKRALMGDALSHATLPGIAIVFILLGAKSLPLLLLGATISGVLGVAAVIGLRAMPRIREDAAIGIVLSVFFGLGMVLFSYVQQMQTGNEAGLAGFIYGKAAAMIARDAYLIGGAACIVIVACTLLFKEFRLVCFDPAYAGALGYGVLLVDFSMMALVVMTTVVGLQAVGLILIVALLIIPAAAARFWTDRLSFMTLVAGVFGAVSGYLGASCSALMPRLPTGAVIVLWTGVLFLLSMFAAPRRGIVAAAMRRLRVRRSVALQNVLRALAEIEETRGEGALVSVADLAAARTWSRRDLHRGLREARRDGALESTGAEAVRLTPDGRVKASWLLRGHRVWESYLMRHAAGTLPHIDEDADEVEHVLSPEMVRELEQAVEHSSPLPLAAGATLVQQGRSPSP